MSTRNFWYNVNCLLIVALYSLEAVARHPQKGGIKFYILGFQIVVRGLGESEIFLGGNFLSGQRNLRRSDFDDSNLFKAKNSLLRILNIN